MRGVASDAKSLAFVFGLSFMSSRLAGIQDLYRLAADKAAALAVRLMPESRKMRARGKSPQTGLPNATCGGHGDKGTSPQGATAAGSLQLSRQTTAQLQPMTVRANIPTSPCPPVCQPGTKYPLCQFRRMR